jgi:hypothetical protein
MQNELNEDFIECILQKYHGTTSVPTDVSLLEYLIERGVIPCSIISKYMILEYYPSELQACPTKEIAIQSISDKTGFSTAHVRYTLNDPRQFYSVRLKKQK